MAIREQVELMKASSQPIRNAQDVVAAVKDSKNIIVSGKLVRETMKKDMGLSFVKAKKLHANANSPKVMVQRQQYAIKMLELLEQGTRIINIDETWLNETSFIRNVWTDKKGFGNTRLNTVAPRLSMIAALDTDGKVWFSLAHAATDSDVIALFLK